MHPLQRARWQLAVSNSLAQAGFMNLASMPNENTDLLDFR